MNYSEILAQLKAASAFDLYRLRAAIDRALDEPAWMVAVQARLRVGQTVEYFDPQGNASHTGQVLELRRKQAVVLDKKTDQRWLISYAAPHSAAPISRWRPTSSSSLTCYQPILRILSLFNNLCKVGITMDPVHSPYAPGAGSPPPELAGRDELRRVVRIALQRIRIGNPAKSVLMVGLRGVGKTVLLEQIRIDTEAEGMQTVRMEVPEGRSLPALLAPQLRVALLRLSRVEAAKDVAKRGLSALAGFAKALRITYQDIEVGLDFEPEPGLADNGDLEADLATLLEQVGIAAKEAGTAVVMFIDELQYIKEVQFSALISALHRCAQLRLPVMLVGAGLPQLRERAGSAKSYAERLFDYPEVGPLTSADARKALESPANALGVKFDDDAVKSIIAHTRGYPYFLQEWGKHAWELADASPITLSDVERASNVAIAALDESFFRVRFDRMTPLERRYLRAMAELGPGPHRSGDIAAVLGREVSALAPTRGKIINKGMVWSPSHGDTAFTVPLFDEFMKRIMPGDSWRNESA